MIVYEATCDQFHEQVADGVIGDRVREAWIARYGFEPNMGEKMAWANSLTQLHFAAKKAGLSQQGILIEFSLPQYGGRLDAMFTGADSNGADSAAVIELKQWSHCESSDAEKVVTWVGGGHRSVLHPSVQVGGYVSRLLHGSAEFHEDRPDAIKVWGGSFLHNYHYEQDDPLLDKKFATDLAKHPIFTRDLQAELVTALEIRVGGAGGESVLDRVINSKALPSKKLLESLGAVLDGKPEFILLDEQEVSFDRVMTEARKALATGTRATILVNGGPGTGKSVVAINLLAALSREGFNTHYSTPSTALKTTFKKFVGNVAAQQVTRHNAYAMSEPASIDVLLIDESHRLKESGVEFYTSKDQRSGKPLVQEIHDASKVSVFFIDEFQAIRPKEIGSRKLIEAAAADHDRDYYAFDLLPQFRCAGSDGFVDWVTAMLGLVDDEPTAWRGMEGFDFEIVDSPVELAGRITDLSVENVARVTAGFCWPWSDPLTDGTLPLDVKVGELEMPWNAKSGKKRLAEGIPPNELWATEAGGENQVGCIYTAQGFEFDYVGVIFGPDLVYRDGEGWVGIKDALHDKKVKSAKDDLTRLLKNTYRVLMTRGMKGCYVHFMDEETKAYWRAHVEIEDRA